MWLKNQKDSRTFVPAEELFCFEMFLAGPCSFGLSWQKHALASLSLVQAVAKRMSQHQAMEMSLQQSWNVEPSERQHQLSMAQPAWKTEQQGSQPSVPKTRLPVSTLPGMPTLTPITEEDAEVVVVEQHLEHGPWLAPEPYQPPEFPAQSEETPAFLDTLDEEPTLEGADWDKFWNDHVANIRSTRIFE